MAEVLSLSLYDDTSTILLSDICFRITTQYNPSTCCRKRSVSSLIFTATTELQFHVPSKSQSFNCMVRRKD